MNSPEYNDSNSCLSPGTPTSFQNGYVQSSRRQNYYPSHRSPQRKNKYHRESKEMLSQRNMMSRSTERDNDGQGFSSRKYLESQNTQSLLGYPSAAELKHTSPPPGNDGISSRQFLIKEQRSCFSGTRVDQKQHYETSRGDYKKPKYVNLRLPSKKKVYHTKPQSPVENRALKEKPLYNQVDKHRSPTMKSGLVLAPSHQSIPDGPWYANTGRGDENVAPMYHQRPPQTVSFVADYGKRKSSKAPVGWEYERKRLLVEFEEVHAKYKKYKRRVAKQIEEKKNMKGLIAEFEITVQRLKQEQGAEEAIQNEVERLQQQNAEMKGLLERHCHKDLQLIEVSKENFRLIDKIVNKDGQIKDLKKQMAHQSNEIHQLIDNQQNRIFEKAEMVNEAKQADKRQKLLEKALYENTQVIEHLDSKYTELKQLRISHTNLVQQYETQNQRIEKMKNQVLDIQHQFEIQINDNKLKDNINQQLQQEIQYYQNHNNPIQNYITKTARFQSSNEKDSYDEYVARRAFSADTLRNGYSHQVSSELVSREASMVDTNKKKTIRKTRNDIDLSNMRSVALSSDLESQQTRQTPNRAHKSFTMPSVGKNLELSEAAAGKAKVQQALKNYKNELKKKKQFQPFDQMEKINKIKSRTQNVSLQDQDINSIMQSADNLQSKLRQMKQEAEVQQSSFETGAPARDSLDYKSPASRQISILESNTVSPADKSQDGYVEFTVGRALSLTHLVKDPKLYEKESKSFDHSQLTVGRAAQLGKFIKSQDFETAGEETKQIEI